MSNVIEFFPGLRVVENKKSNAGIFKSGLVDFDAINPSHEIEFVNDERNMKLDMSVSENEPEPACSVEIHSSSTSLILYNRNGYTYKLFQPAIHRSSC